MCGEGLQRKVRDANQHGFWPTLPSYCLKIPRYYQIAVLFSLLLYGVGWLSFDVDGHAIAMLLGTVLVAQFLCTSFFSSSAFDCRSALISGLSLCLLLRTNDSTLTDCYSRHYDRQQILAQVER
jgi:hypothetical protein